MDVVPFQFDSHSVRAFYFKDEPWFVAKDVAAALGYADTVNAVKTHCKSAKSLKELGVAKHHPYTNQGVALDPQTKVIPESDVYLLTLRSKLPSAEKFQVWVCNDVIPSIRKTGKYQQPSAEPDPVVEQKTGVQIPTGIFDPEMQRELTALVTSCMTAGMAKQEAFAYAHAVVMSWAQVGNDAPKQAASAVRHIHTDDVPADGDYADSTTIAGLVGVPAKDRMGQRRSIPFLLRDAGLLEPAERARLTTEGEKFGVAKRVNGHDRIYWKKEDTVAHLRSWIELFGWHV